MLSLGRIKLWDGDSRFPKAVLEKVTFDGQLPDCLEHLARLLLQQYLLPLGFLLGLVGRLKDAAGIFKELLAPTSEHIRMEIILGSNCLEGFSSFRTSRTILVLNSGLYVFRAMVIFSSSSHCLQYTMFTIFLKSLVQF